MAQLGEALDGAFAGRGTVVLLAGEPGIGKTSIARALSDEAEARGAAAVWGIGWAGNAAPAYWPWVQVVRALVRRPDGDDLLAGLRPGAAWLGEIVPELGTEVSGLPRLPRGSAEEGRFHVYDALAELLRRAAARGSAARRARRPAVGGRGVAAHAGLRRPGTAGRRRRAARDVPRPPRCRTTSSARRASADLIGWSRRIELRGPRAGGRAAPGRGPRQRRRARRGRRAHPLPDRRQSALRLRAAHSARATRAGSTTSRPRGELPLPEGVREAIGQRLAPLTPEARDALAVGSVIGAQFRVATLSRAAGVPRDDVLELARCRGRARAPARRSRPARRATASATGSCRPPCTTASRRAGAPSSTARSARRSRRCTTRTSARRG